MKLYKLQKYNCGDGVYMKIYLGSRYIFIFLLIASVVAVFAREVPLVNIASAQEVPDVVNVTVSPKTVYRGYQVIEIVAYLYIPPDVTLRTASAYAVLSSGGVSQNLTMTLVTLTAPIQITVGNVTYNINRLFIIRVPVSFGLAPGPATLTVYTTGLAVRGNETYDLTKTFRFTVTILDHLPVDMKRMEAYLAVERARTLFNVLQSLGISIPTDLRASLNNIISDLEKGDEALFTLGDVDKALSIYDRVASYSEKLSADILLLASAYFSNTSRSIDTLSSRVDSLDKSVKTLSDSLSSLAQSLQSMNKDLGNLAKALSDYSVNVRNTLAQLNTNIDNTNKKIDNAINSLNTDLNNKLSSLASNISKSFENINNSLSTIQLVLVVLGVAILIIGGLMFVRR